MIHFYCPKCSAEMSHTTAGEELSCWFCGQRVRVPNPPPDQPTAAMPPELTPTGSSNKPDAQPGIPPFRRPKVFSEGEHTVEFRLWAVTVVKVEKTVTTDVEGGGGSGYLYTDYKGRIYGNFASEPISTHHKVDWQCWVQDDRGMETCVPLDGSWSFEPLLDTGGPGNPPGSGSCQNIPLPGASAMREGHRLTLVYGKATNQDDWVLITLVNHTTAQYAGEKLRSQAEQVAETVPYVDAKFRVLPPYLSGLIEHCKVHCAALARPVPGPGQQ
jgi:hypothetical protein